MKEKLDFKKTLLLSSLIFGMFFGAGNLIFPVHLGQLAGQNWLIATTGFLMSAIIIPWLALIALSQTRSAGIYDIAKPVGRGFAIFFLIATHVSLGPMIATPRTATVAYSLSFSNWLPKQAQGVGLFLFSAIFFALVFWIGSREQNITKYIGKYLNPLFIILLLLIFLLAILHPMGSLSHAANAAYQTEAFSSAFLEGYNTLDALAALAFGITIVRAIQMMGFQQSAVISKITAKTGLIAILGIAIVYVGLILLGATSLSQFKFSENGTVALTQIMMYYLGDFGSAFLAVMGTLAVLTTAIGLTASFAQDFHRIFPKVSYRSWLILTIGLSFGASNFGLDTIISWAEPLLMFLYPIAIALIILGIASPLFNQARIVYLPTMILTFIPAIIDGIQHLPFNIALLKPFLTWYVNTIPMANVGLEWLTTTLIGFVLGLALYKLQGRNKVTLVENF
ncbi:MULTISPECIES: branched-chain amino acid transport system II carrier protein [Leuconostoc]|uniref:Branched-chain amino acid transport system carrier protein n=2 Tax=Leuconostoc kimchii TaxID=136609 RepID=D5T0Q5_LEUKI|nr:MULTISPECIES: branched-chain amino acid transport system II carrier protein [Leuconostoc]ADG39854.1 putative branched-chain amino acid transporter [Leuconostoc kimchii IMSNU 11154]AEJ30287.1 putative branched-chain amino acid transporter [Leuconostoc sp. C2]QBR47357.1 branched-chain amino acid transport system II carrier protein [Leuconostoc kimchii]